MSKLSGDSLVMAPTTGAEAWADEEDLEARLGSGAIAWLRHLLDGQPICLPAMTPGSAPVRYRSRSPSVRVVVGEVIRDASSGKWCGPVVIEGDARATYVDPLRVVHRHECARCDRVWSTVGNYLASRPSAALFRVDRPTDVSLPLGVELASWTPPSGA